MNEGELLDRLGWLSRKAREKEICVILILEGNDVIGIKKLSGLIASRVNPGNLLVSGPPERNCGLEHLPFLVPYQAKIPPAGDLWILEHSWFHEIIYERITKSGSEFLLESRLKDIRGFERTITSGRYRIVRVGLLRSLDRLTRDYKRKVKGGPLEGVLKGKYFPVLRHGQKYLDLLEKLFLLEKGEGRPWIVPDAEKRKEARIQAMEAICETLDVEFGVDSVQETLAFSREMDEMRRKIDAGDRT